MKATDVYRRINNSPIKGIILYYTEKLLQLDEVKLGTVIAQIQTGKTPPKANLKYYASEDINWFKPSDIGYDKYLSEAKEKIANVAQVEKKATIYSKNTLLMIGIGGGVGRVSILKEKGSSNQQITGVLFNDDVSVEYAYYYYLVREDYIKSQAKSMSFPILNQARIKELLFKYPTLKEQNDFVEFIDHCLTSFLDSKSPNFEKFNISNELKKYALKQFKSVELDSKIKNNIKHELKLLIQLKQSILQDAIQGKLTKNWRKENPTMEPASELLKRIKAEKAQLVKEKKIRKEKPLPVIAKEEIPFELPEGWSWCRLGDITNYGSSIKIESKDIEPNTWVLDLEDIEKESSRILQQKTFKERPSLSAKSVFQNGWVLYSKLRPYLDKVVVANKDGVCTTEILPLQVFSNMTPKFMMYGLKSNHFLKYVNSKVSGMKMPRLKTHDGKMALIPIGPVKEQKAIVQKVETLLQKCTALEQEIAQSEANAEMLMQAVLKEAFEKRGEKV